MRVSAEELRQKLYHYLHAKELDFELTFYTQDEWRARGEPWGDEAVLSITTEGELCHLLNGLTGDGSQVDEFQEYVESLGYWYEMGYRWSLHFYPDDFFEQENQT